MVIHRHQTGSFNPTMVRLLQVLLVLVRRTLVRFQSHNGAIAAALLLSQAVPAVMFQSHNGAIAASQQILDAMDAVLFQSHNGAIAAYLTSVLWTPKS